jgi:hypothetical protein
MSQVGFRAQEVLLLLLLAGVAVLLQYVQLRHC